MLKQKSFIQAGQRIEYFKKKNTKKKKRRHITLTKIQGLK